MRVMKGLVAITMEDQCTANIPLSLQGDGVSPSAANVSTPTVSS